MARAALGWTLDETADTSGVNRRTILRYEQRESSMRSKNLTALRTAFERAGVRFIDEGTDAGGVVPPALEVE
jgi:transcriptional regulator with XRE-family HTH domain